MPLITVVSSKGEKSIDVPENKRLVLAVEEIIDIGHICGGYAQCTTCQVEFLEGEPQKMTKAEKNKLHERGLLGKVRLACQILVTHDMKVRPKFLVSEKGKGPGDAPKTYITPEPEWIKLESI